jgi:hypothetical protein
MIMALLGLCGAMAAAAWQQYGDQAKAMAAEWAPPFVLAALPSATRPAASSSRALRPLKPPHRSGPPRNRAAAAAPAQPEPAARRTRAAPSAESAQLQSMAQDLATMGSRSRS